MSRNHIHIRSHYHEIKVIQRELHIFVGKAALSRPGVGLGSNGVPFQTYGEGD